MSIITFVSKMSEITFIKKSNLDKHEIFFRNFFVQTKCPKFCLFSHNFATVLFLIQFSLVKFVRISLSKLCLPILNQKN